jgi:hypothetical protein
MENLDARLIDVDYRSPENIAYLVAMLEQVWGIERINTLMNAVKEIRLNQEAQEI